MKPKQHPYCYPGTEVYRNKEGIRDAEQLEKLERRLTAERLMTLPDNLPVTVEGSFSKSQIHGKMNGGGQPLTIHTGDGSIRLSKT